jgi:hypothetical protein
MHMHTCIEYTKKEISIDAHTTGQTSPHRQSNIYRAKHNEGRRNHVHAYNQANKYTPPSRHIQTDRSICMLASKHCHDESGRALNMTAYNELVPLTNVLAVYASVHTYYIYTYTHNTYYIHTQRHTRYLDTFIHRYMTHACTHTQKATTTTLKQTALPGHQWMSRGAEPGARRHSCNMMRGRQVSHRKQLKNNHPPPHTNTTLPSLHIQERYTLM